MGPFLKYSYSSVLEIRWQFLETDTFLPTQNQRQMGWAWRWCGWFGLLQRLPCKAPGWCYHSTNHKRMTGHPFVYTLSVVFWPRGRLCSSKQTQNLDLLLGQKCQVQYSCLDVLRKQRAWCSKLLVHSALTWIWGEDREDYVQLLSAWQQISAPAFFFWPVDGCIWDNCSEISSQSREKNTHFLQKCSFRYTFCDQINPLNRFFLFLVGAWVNATSNWHISFREKSDWPYEHALLLSSTSKLRTTDQPGKSAVTWADLLKQHKFLAFCHLLCCCPYIAIESCYQFLYFLLLPRQGFLSPLHSFLVLAHVQWTMPWSYLECTSDVYTTSGDSLKYILMQNKTENMIFCTKLDVQLEWINENCWLLSSEPTYLFCLIRSPCIWLLDPYLWFSIQGNNFWLFLLLMQIIRICPKSPNITSFYHRLNSAACLISQS